MKDNYQPDCLFCQIVQGEADSYQLYEDKQVLAFLDLYPQSYGHTLVIPKNHSRNMLKTKDDDLAAVMTATKKVANSIQKSLNADGFIIKTNINRIAGQVINHLHIHIIPKYRNQEKNQARGKASVQYLQQAQETITSHLSTL